MKQRRQPTNVKRVTAQDESALAGKFQEELMEGGQRLEKETFGKVFKSDQILEQELEFLSDGNDGAGNEYKLYIGRLSRNPIVTNPKTGLCFVLPWPDIIKLAKTAGLNH